jgi:hypothetical protein
VVEIDDIKLFELAHEGKLNADENNQFQHMLETDQVFKSNYDKYQRLIAAINDQQHYDSLRNLLDEIYKSRNWLLSPEEQKSRKMGPVLLIGVMAILLLVIVGTIWYVTGDHGEVEDSAPKVSEVLDNKEVEKAGQNQETLAEGIHSEGDATQTVPELVESSPGNPTAFMISQQGYFITQFSPVKNSRSLRLRQNDTTEFKVGIVATDSVLDLAVLKLTDANWPANLRLPYRLATTRALTGTEVMLVKHKGIDNHLFAAVNEDETDDTKPEFYHVPVQNVVEFSGGPVISRNGNVVAVVIETDGKQSYLKSTYVNGFLAQHAAQMPDYRMAVDNRLAGLERDAQLERLNPFVLEVIRFY